MLVTGHTKSVGFPLAHTVVGTTNNGTSATNYDAFAAKLDPTGSKLLYSTFLRGVVIGIGNPLPETGFGPAWTEEAIVFKLCRTVPAKSTRPRLGGSDRTEGTAIAVDRAGAAYVGGINKGP